MSKTVREKILEALEAHDQPITSAIVKEHIGMTVSTAASTMRTMAKKGDIYRSTYKTKNKSYLYSLKPFTEELKAALEAPVGIHKRRNNISIVANPDFEANEQEIPVWQKDMFKNGKPIKAGRNLPIDHLSNGGSLPCGAWG